MFHFTIFGGSEVTLQGGGQVVFTMFGGTDIRKPTLAKRLMQEKERLQGAQGAQVNHPGGVNRMRHLFGREPAETPAARPHRGSFVLTIFGAVELKPPSVAEEFMDMRELVSSGMLDAREWDELVGRLYQMGDLDSISSFTIFGGMGEEPLKQEEEVKKIRSASELGLISENEEKALRSVVGRDPEQVRMLLRQTAFA